MAYRVYSGPRGSAMLSPIDKEKMLYKQCGRFDEAMAWARHVVAEGRTVLLIEGDDGTSMTKHEIAAAMQHSSDIALRDGNAA